MLCFFFGTLDKLPYFYILCEAVFVCVTCRSHSILSCASPSNSGSTVGGFLLDGKLSDSLLDSFMDPPSLTGLCPAMQVQHSVREHTPVTVSHYQFQRKLLVRIQDQSCVNHGMSHMLSLLQVSRQTSQSSLSKMRLFVCRHGERMDVVFGKHWVTQCFDSKG